MIDTFMRFTDETEARGQINFPAESPLPESWIDRGATVMPVTAWSSRPVHGPPVLDPGTGKYKPSYNKPPTVSPYYWMWCTSEERVPELEALAGCAIVCQRELAPDKSCVLMSKLTAKELDVTSVFPVFAGTDYPFGRQV